LGIKVGDSLSGRLPKRGGKGGTKCGHSGNGFRKKDLLKGGGFCSLNKVKMREDTGVSKNKGKEKGIKKEKQEGGLVHTTVSPGKKKIPRIKRGSAGPNLCTKRGGNRKKKNLLLIKKRAPSKKKEWGGGVNQRGGDERGATSKKKICDVFRPFPRDDGEKKVKKNRIRKNEKRRPGANA